MGRRHSAEQSPAPETVEISEEAAHETVAVQEQEFEHDLDPGVQEAPEDEQREAAESAEEQQIVGPRGGKSKRTQGQKAEAFSRLASGRASAAVTAMRLLSNLANPVQYHWTEDQENKIFDTLEEQLRVLRKLFIEARTSAKHKPGKQLPISV
jgi:hypothetical protein